MSDYKLIAGLGNPGTRYEHTRHNIGFKAAEYFVEKISERKLEELSAFRLQKDWAGKDGCRIAEISYEGEKVLVVEPATFMNLSGEPIREIASFFRIDPHQIVVLHDELDLPSGTVRIKTGGGDGGHNGLKSVTSSLGSGDYVRIRMGIGRPDLSVFGGSGQAPDVRAAGAAPPDVSAWVLGRFTAGEEEALQKMLSGATEALTELFRSGVKQAQNKFNRRNV